jgi:hypothetical protein
MPQLDALPQQLEYKEKVGEEAGRPAATVERLLANTVTPYLFSTVQVGVDDVRLDYRSTVLGVVPAHKVRVLVPLADVADARVAPSVHLDRLAVGAVLIVLGAVLDLWVPVRSGLAVIGLVFVVLSVVACLRLTTRSGRRYDAPICLREIRRGDRLCALIRARRPSGTPPSREDATSW